MKLLLLKHFSSAVENEQSYFTLTLTVLEAEDISKHVFVKQRFKVNYTDEDQFATVSSLAHLNDIPEGQPTDDSSYFRDSSITFKSGSATTLRNIYQIAIKELTSLLSELELATNSAAYSQEEITFKPSFVL